PGELVLRRTLDRAGRSRCFINGHAATLAQLKEAGEWLLDLHGQHAHQSLLRTAAQRELLNSTPDPRAWLAKRPRRIATGSGSSRWPPRRARSSPSARPNGRTSPKESST